MITKNFHENENDKDYYKKLFRKSIVNSAFPSFEKKL